MNTATIGVASLVETQRRASAHSAAGLPRFLSFTYFSSGSLTFAKNLIWYDTPQAFAQSLTLPRFHVHQTPQLSGCARNPRVIDSRSPNADVLHCRTLEPIHDIKSCLISRGVSQPVRAFDFERFEEALHWCIIPAITFPAHRLRHFKLLEKPAVFSAGVLIAAVRVHQKPWRRPATPVRHLQRIAHQLRAHPLAHRPTHDPACS